MNSLWDEWTDAGAQVCTWQLRHWPGRQISTDKADLSGIDVSNLFRSGASQELCSLPVLENVTGII